MFSATTDHSWRGGRIEEGEVFCKKVWAIPMRELIALAECRMGQRSFIPSTSETRALVSVKAMLHCVING